MASSYTDLGIELMATGENAGTWGTKTNNNLSLFEQLTGGFNSQAVTDSGTPTALTIVDGETTGTAQHQMIELTGSISGARVVTIPLDVEKMYYIRNSTSGAYTVQFKYVSGSGDTFTFAADNKGDAVLFATANDGTNPDIYTLPAGLGDVTLTGTQTLTNKTLTSPKIGTKIDDTNGNELINLTATSSAVNEFTLANAATGNGPILSSTGETNVDININPKGTGVLKSGTAAVKIAGKESIWVPALAMYPNSTNGCADLAQVELSNGPEIKTLDFDKDSDEFAQFAVAFPKSWNEGTVTFQAFFTADTTNTGTTAWTLAGVAIADDDSCNTAFGTGVTPTAKAMSGTANDLAVTAESGAVTIAGSPGVNEEVFFQISRDVSLDSLTADAKLLGIKLFFTTDAANDA
jgi:hypothetical protein